MEWVGEIGAGVLWWVTSLPLAEWLAWLITIGCVLMLVQKDLQAVDSMKDQCDPASVARMMTLRTYQTTATLRSQDSTDWSARGADVRRSIKVCTSKTLKDIQHRRHTMQSAVGTAGGFLGNQTSKLLSKRHSLLQGGVSESHAGLRHDGDGPHGANGGRHDTGTRGKISHPASNGIWKDQKQNSGRDTVDGDFGDVRRISNGAERSAGSAQPRANEIRRTRTAGAADQRIRGGNTNKRSNSVRVAAARGSQMDTIDEGYQPSQSSAGPHSRSNGAIQRPRPDNRVRDGNGSDADIEAKDHMDETDFGAAEHDERRRAAPEVGLYSESYDGEYDVIENEATAESRNRKFDALSQDVLNYDEYDEYEDEWARREEFLEYNPPFDGDNEDEWAFEGVVQSMNEEENRSSVDARIALLEEDNSALRAVNEKLVEQIGELRSELRGAKEHGCVDNEPLPDDIKMRRVSGELKHLMVQEKDLSCGRTASPLSSTCDTTSDVAALRVEPQGASANADDVVGNLSSNCLQDNYSELLKTTIRILTNSLDGSNRKATYQVICMGDSGVGKTSFIRRLCHEHYNETFRATICVDFAMKSFYINGHHVVLQIWDTAGQERYRSLTKQYLRKADAILVFYDVTAETSFKNVRHWMASVEDCKTEDTVVALVGNKRDMVQDSYSGRVITRSHGALLAEEYGAMFHECSAKSGEGVNETMNDMISLLLLKRPGDDDITEPETIKLLHSSNKSETTCCGISTN